MRINQFKKDDIGLNNKYLVIGSEGYGVQTIAKSLIYHNRNKFHNSLMLSSYDSNTNNSYSSMIGNLKVLKDAYGESDYMGGDNVTKNELHLKDFINSQKKRIRDQIFNTSTLEFTKDKCLIILNNVSEYWLKSKIIKSLIMESRQFNICLIIITQYPFGLDVSQRSNIDYIFMTHGQSNKDKLKLYNYYGGFMDFRYFNDLFDFILKRYGCYSCVVVSQINQSENIKDLIFWWVPKSLNTLKFVSIDN
jgi:hypothetical protein